MKRKIRSAGHYRWHVSAGVVISGYAPLVKL